jgi:hypothetical protein
VRHVTAVARTFSGDQCRQPTSANPGGDVIANPASELSPRTSYTRKSTASGGGFIRASVGNVPLNESRFIDYGQLLGKTDVECGHSAANIHSKVDASCEFKALSTDAHGFCTTFDLVAFKPFGAGEFRSALFELRRSDAMDARNFFAASANCLERNRLRGALGGTIEQDESHVGNSVIGHDRTIPVGLDTGRRVADGRSHGSQWLYLLKGAPTVLAGIVFMSLLADNPDQIGWLTVLEKRLLRARMAEKRTSVSEGSRLSALLDAFRGPTVWIFGGILFGFVMGIYGIGFRLPRIISDTITRSSGQIGLLGAIPWTSGSTAMLTIARHSDATSERRWHVAVAGVAFAASAILSRTAAAAGFAWINSVGNVAGPVSPFPTGRRSISGMT